MEPPTPQAAVAQYKLGVNLHDWIRRRRPGLSWRLIAAELKERTGEDRHEDTIRAWWAAWYPPAGTDTPSGGSQ